MPGKNKKEYLDFVVEWLSPLGEITARNMMGGHVLYCGGTVFALIADNALYLKADDVTRPQFEALGLKPFQPFPDQPGTMQYYPPPAEFFEDAEAREEWGGAAVKCGLRARTKGKKKPSPRQR